MVGDTLEVADAVHHLRYAAAVLARDTALGQAHEIAVYLVLVVVDEVFRLYDGLALLLIVVRHEEVKRVVYGFAGDICHFNSCTAAGLDCDRGSLEEALVESSEAVLLDLGLSALLVTDNDA